MPSNVLNFNFQVKNIVHTKKLQTQYFTTGLQKYIVASLIDHYQKNIFLNVKKFLTSNQFF